jgi:hypothetical protein
VVLQLDELLVKLKQLLGTQFAFGEELLLRVSEHLFAVPHRGVRGGRICQDAQVPVWL